MKLCMKKMLVEREGVSILEFPGLFKYIVTEIL